MPPELASQLAVEAAGPTAAAARSKKKRRKNAAAAAEKINPWAGDIGRWEADAEHAWSMVLSSLSVTSGGDITLPILPGDEEKYSEETVRSRIIYSRTG